jgi:tetrahydromethanopterin S-methyltransferase subunit G
VKQMERGVPDSAGLAEMQQRLERIEQAVDAMAVEVERIAEGQRFVTRLLAEKGQERPGLTI